MNLPPYSPLLARIIVHNIIIPIIYLALGYLLAGHLFSFTSSTSWIIYHFLSWVLAYCVQIVVEFHQRLLQLHITVETPKDSCSQHGLSIPIIPSEYPFNIDILFQWMNEGKTEYFGKGMIQRLSGRFGQINGRRIKTFNTKIFGENSIVTFSAHHSHQILSLPLATNIFEKGSKFRERAYSLLGDGVFGSDGDVWRLHRKMSRSFFAGLAKRSSDIREKSSHGREDDDEEEEAGLNEQDYEDTEERDRGDVHVKRLIGFMTMHEKEGTGFDMQALFNDFTLEMTIDLIVGRKGNDRGKVDDGIARPSVLEFAKAFSEAQSILSTRIRIGTLWSLFELTGDRMTAPMKVIRGFVRPLVEDGLRRKGGGGGSLLDHLVGMTNDRKFIEDEVINILIAARDTTTSALSSCIYCMAMYPNVQDRLRDLVGRSDVASQSGLKIPYLKAFIHEVLRLYPPVPLNIRRSNATAVLHPDHPDEPALIFPPNTSVILAFALIQRDKELWGDDADEFRPERWMNRDREFTMAFGSRPGFQAFNIGPRICLGQGFAMQLITHVLVRLLRHTHQSGSRLVLAPELQPEGTGPPMEWQMLRRGREEKCWMTSDVVLTYKGGLWVRWKSEAGTTDDMTGYDMT